MHRHHRKLRSRGGTDEPANVMSVTAVQHDWIHRNPKKARAIGWMVHSWEDPNEVPILVAPCDFDPRKEYA